MDKKFFIKNISAAFLANLISMIASLILVCILPKFVGVLQYSYYQLYLFYTSYIGFLGLGWLDGIQLRHGGEYYEKLNKPLIKSEFLIFTAVELFFSLCIILIALLYCTNISKQIVFVAIALCVSIYVPRALLHNILQATAKIKEYAYTIIIERIVHVSVTILGIILGQDSFIWFVGAELFGRFLGTLYVFYTCKDIFFATRYPLGNTLFEAKQNINCGLFLMISNVASMLIIGVIRQFIEIFWNVETFGKISLTLSISNFVLTFINSVALVFFPFLKRSPKEKLTQIYKYVSITISVFTPMILFLYLPLKYIFSIWLPQYSNTLVYLAFLFPICIFESKMSLLINTYMKALRLEKLLLLTNSICVITSIIISFISCKVFHSLTMAVLSIVIILAIRCIIGETILAKNINIKILKNIFSELCLSFCFILLALFNKDKVIFITYIVIYLIYLVIRKKDIFYIIKER